MSNHANVKKRQGIELAHEIINAMIGRGQQSIRIQACAQELGRYLVVKDEDKKDG